MCNRSCAGRKEAVKGREVRPRVRETSLLNSGLTMLCLASLTSATTAVTNVTAGSAIDPKFTPRWRRCTGYATGVRWHRVIRFIETSVFTRHVIELMADAEYSRLQAALVLQPELGDLIPGTGGLRKVRWGEQARGRGKRGGVRVIYYWYQSESLIYFLLAYSKGQRDDPLCVNID